MERNEIAGIAADRNEARVTLTGVPDQPGTVAKVISPLAESGIAFDMIVHAATPDSGASDLTFTVPRASLSQAIAVIEAGRRHRLRRASTTSGGQVSIVGAALLTRSLPRQC